MYTFGAIRATDFAGDGVREDKRIWCEESM